MLHDLQRLTLPRFLKHLVIVIYWSCIIGLTGGPWRPGKPPPPSLPRSPCNISRTESDAVSSASMSSQRQKLKYTWFYPIVYFFYFKAYFGPIASWDTWRARRAVVAVDALRFGKQVKDNYEIRQQDLRPETSSRTISSQVQCGDHVLLFMSIKQMWGRWEGTYRQSWVSWESW